MQNKVTRNVSIIAAIFGLVDAGYLVWLKYGNDDILCVGGCDVVNSSKYSEVFGIPIAIFAH